MVWWVFVGKAAALLGIGAGKIAALTATAFKIAAVGTAFTIKGLVFTKTGGLALTVAIGAATYLQATDATVDAISEFGYKSDSISTIPMIKQDINIIVSNQGTYTVLYCEVGEEKIVVPSSYNVCPQDGSMPKEGHSFDFTE